MHDSPRKVERYEVRAVEYARGHEISDFRIGVVEYADEAYTMAWKFYDRHHGEDFSVYVKDINGEVHGIAPRGVRNDRLL